MNKSPTPKVKIVRGNDVPLASVLDFCRVVYGAHSHQANPEYYQWAYTENPNCPEGLDSLVIACDDEDRVVGTMNRLLMEWDVKGERMVIPALGDFAVDPAHRKGGLGLRMALTSTKGVEHAFVNGSNPSSSPLFRALKYQELTGGRWFRKVLNPLRASGRYLWYRLGGSARPSDPLFVQPAIAGYHISDSPNEHLLAGLAALLNRAPAQVKLHWTVDTLRWRFFHPKGPRHIVLFSSQRDGSPSNALFISAGHRKGLRACRLIAHQCSDSTSFAQLLKVAITLLRRSGVDVLLAFTFSAKEAGSLSAAGMREQQDPPATFFHHRRQANMMEADEVLVQGAASDLGMEAMTVSK
ncbi:MAG: hypothetical protein WBG34_10495 [Flavobacteriales bacterium]